ncbi:MAG: hypothetical protein UV20_C0007G0012 [Candidatus Magasanikbacteria bacterium GW2011_GWA2_42_32]|uniref:Radical SAM core domain-containing protein n=1 Tax=Candidatus Magasanikbacteria bacterium GW2011_GWA2_42_32 TaxID=1619039 RepID=A0A0G1A6N4_9BACT|nr:MAG: hypothetical protein UV20_C0007G0012 [Candidatus Magasanikbacteria bacterium GW2011_GWA2_42_32]
MKSIIIPESYNYIAVFLTFSCNLRCSFCINDFGSVARTTKRRLLSGKEWVEGLNRIVSRPDLPITLQGGEPTLHKDFVYIINNIKPELNIDVLTNLRDEKIFIGNIDPRRLKRDAPYASIRVSYHPEQMSLNELIRKVLKMQNNGFSVGIWGIMHPKQEIEILKAEKYCKSLGIDFRTKEFLGTHKGKIYGQYRYPGAISKRDKKSVFCKTTELIIGPNGDIYRCTADVYEKRKSIGHILDPDFQIEDKFRLCEWFGHCNPCDIKVKTNRFQQFGHSSVEIKFQDQEV